MRGADGARGRSVLVTGAASGIGRATAERFAAAGWVVGAYDVDLVADLPAGVHTGRLDVTDPDAWAETLRAFTAHTGGRLDVLVNNAGVLTTGAFAEVPLAEHLRTVRVNLDGVLIGCHAAHPYLRAARGSRVINLCSAAAIYGQPELAVYSATKYAVRGLSEALELEWRADGIGVTALWPLWVATPLIAGEDAASLRRLGVHLTAAEVAGAILAVVERPPRLGVHRTVGWQARVFRSLAQVSPDLLNRAVNRLISGR